MSKKQDFIKYVEELMQNQKTPIQMSENAQIYWENFCGQEEVEN